MAGRAAEQELLKRLPSLEDGIDVETEAQLRVYGAESIQRAGVLLRVPQITIVSASVIFQQFYCRRSFAEFDVESSSCAALLLACKLEETHRKLRDVVLVFHRLQMRAHEESGEVSYAGRPTPSMDITGKEYVEMKQEVIKAEGQLLLELGFEVEKLQDHPHRHLLILARSLGEPSGAFLQLAWNCLNDSLRTLLVCAYEPHVIAAASIFLASRATGLKLPSNPPWWHAVGADLEDIRHIAKSILALYGRAPAQYIYVPRRKKPRVEAAGPPITPATPFPETPAPLKSPSGSEPGDENAGDAVSETVPRQDSAATVDADRLAEMIDEPRSGGNAAAAALLAPIQATSAVQSRSDEDRRKSKKESRDEKEKEKMRRPVAPRDEPAAPRDEKEKERSAPDRRGSKEKDRERERAKERDKKKGREKHARSSSSSSGDGASRSRSHSAEARRAKTATKQRTRGAADHERKKATRRAASSSDDSSSSPRPTRRKRPVDEREL